MHELGTVFYVIREVEQVVEENHLTKVASVTLEIGEVSGMILHQTASALLGSRMTFIITISANIIGMVTGNCSCWVSCTLSTALPIAANIAA